MIAQATTDELGALLSGAATLSRAGNRTAAIAALASAVRVAPDDLAAHRRLAKLHHPDRQTNATEAERENSDRRIRELNIAYMELRRRKGR